MRVDLNVSLAASASGEEISGSSGVKLRPDAEARTVQPANVVQLPTGSDAIERLIVQLNGVPDVRQPQVEALKSSIEAGAFQVHPDRLADSMLLDEQQKPKRVSWC